MKALKNAARVAILVLLSVCISAYAATSWASGQDAQASSHSVSAADNHGGAIEGAGHGDGGGHGAAHGNSLSKEKLKDLFWRVVNFAALLIILVKFCAKPIGNALSSRRNDVKEEIESVESKRVAAEKSFKDFEQKLAGVEQEIETIVERAIAQAEIEKAKIIEKAEQTAADIKRQAELAVIKEINDAKRILKIEVAEKAAAMAEELIVRNLTANDQVKIIEDYLVKVGAAQ